MNDETITDIIAEMRKQAKLEHGSADRLQKRGNDVDYGVGCSIEEDANYLERIADRLDAALKRERGDPAKLREAIETLVDLVDAWKDNLPPAIEEEVSNALDKAEEALSAPPRNCDLPLVVDGPADNNADKAWLVFKRHNPGAYFDVSGLLRCIDWLLSPATEKKGGNDGH